MEIIGKHNNKLIVKCDAGFYHRCWLGSSGSFFCGHVKGDTYFDFLDVNELEEITDKEIIENIRDYK